LRGNAREDILFEDNDRVMFFDVLGLLYPLSDPVAQD